MFLHENKDTIFCNSSNCENITLPKIFNKVHLPLFDKSKNEVAIENSRISSSSASLKSSRSHIIPRSGRKGFQTFFEDLTEITTVEINTDESQVSRSMLTKNALQLEYIKCQSKGRKFLSEDSNPLWFLIVPDSSYPNAFKFNQQIIQKNKANKFGRKECFNKEPLFGLKLPILRTESHHSKRTAVNLNDKACLPHLENILSDCFYNIMILPEQYTCDFSRFDEQKNEYFLNAVSLKKKVQTNKDFILQNLLRVDFAKSAKFKYFESPSMIVSSSVISSQNDKIQSPSTDNCMCDEPENVIKIQHNTVDDSSKSESIVYHGYIIKPNSVEFHENEVFNQLPVTDLQYSCSKEIFNEFKSDKYKAQKCITQLTIDNVSILPPDILGDVKLSNEHETKRFLSVKSVDEPSWNDFQKIYFDDYSITLNEMENLNSQIENIDIDAESIEDEKHFDDELTSKILEFNDNIIKDKRVRSLKEMNGKMIEIENISGLKDFQFSKSKQILQNQSKQRRKDSKSNDHRIDENRLFSNDIHEEKHWPSEIKGKNSQNQSSFDTFTNVDFIENEDKIFSNNIESATVSKKNANMKRPSLIKSRENGILNRDERERKIYEQRMKNARKIAIETLNEIGLPKKTSDDISIKIINNPTSNEMMINELQRGEHHIIPIKYQSIHGMNTYKPIRRVSFTHKVRLQRPEITRVKYNNKSLPYTNQLFKLKPREENIPANQTIHIPKFHACQSFNDLTPRSIISQNTDINSVLTDWSIPDNVKRILNGNSSRDRLTEDLSQIQSLNSNSVIDWDQISEMLQKYEK